MQGEPGEPDRPGPPSSRRRTAFRVVAIVMSVAAVVFGLVTAIFGIVDEEQEIHAFHNTVVASLLLVLTAPGTIAAARAPDRATRPLVHLSAVGIAGLSTMLVSLTPDPFTLPVIVLVGVLWVLLPTRERAFPPGRPSPILLLLVAAAAVPLIVYALGQAELQRTDNTSDHAEFFHWVETSFYAVAALLLGLLAGLRPAAYRLSAWCAGVAVAVAGAASLALRDYASALTTPWAWAALGGGLAFLAAAELERRRLAPAP
jgi:MFS family permease